MTNAPESSMMTPAIEKLMTRTKSKFLLVTLAARRAREITQQDDNMQIGSYVSRRDRKSTRLNSSHRT
mgnify:CR=1 FL=1